MRPTLNDTAIELLRATAEADHVRWRQTGFTCVTPDDSKV